MGGSEIILVMYWGVENKMTYGQGGHVFRKVSGGVRYVPLVFLFIKSHSYWGAKPPDPPISQLYYVTLFVS